MLDVKKVIKSVTPPPPKKWAPAIPDRNDGAVLNPKTAIGQVPRPPPTLTQKHVRSFHGNTVQLPLKLVSCQERMILPKKWYVAGSQ